MSLLLQDDARDKLLANCRAKLALAGGFVLHELADGSYLVTRWNLSKPLPSLEAVQRFVEQVGG